MLPLTATLFFLKKVRNLQCVNPQLGYTSMDSTLNYQKHYAFELLCISCKRIQIYKWMLKNTESKCGNDQWQHLLHLVDESVHAAITVSAAGRLTAAVVPDEQPLQPLSAEPIPPCHIIPLCIFLTWHWNFCQRWSAVYSEISEDVWAACIRLEVKGALCLWFYLYICVGSEVTTLWSVQTHQKYIVLDVFSKPCPPRYFRRYFS